MKYIYSIIVALALVAFSGCGGSTTLPSTQNAPKFESAAANDYVKVYSDYVNQVVSAYKSKDATKIASLGAQGQDLANKGMNALKDLKGADVQKFQDWAQKVQTEMTQAITGAVK